MKNKVILLIAISAVATLSFTFSSIKREEGPKIEKEASALQFEPAGGFVSEDKF